MYLYGRKKGIGRMNYYVIRSVSGCKRRKEIEAAHGIRERLQEQNCSHCSLALRGTLSMQAQEFRKV